MEGKPVLWEEMTWEEIGERTKTMKMAIVPCGSTEQHGPHLPLLVDWADVYEIAKRVSARTGVFVLHPVVFGTSESHGSFPGAIALRVETMIAFLQDVVRSLYRSGIRKILLLNGHMWNQGAMISVRDNVRCDYDDLQVRFMNWWEGEAGAVSISDLPEAPQNVHANFGETSLMLAVRPDLVKMERAVNERDFFCFWDYRMDQISKSGVVGRNATGATAEDGERIIQLAVDNLTKLVEIGLREEIPYRAKFQSLR